MRIMMAVLMVEKNGEETNIVRDDREWEVPEGVDPTYVLQDNQVAVDSLVACVRPADEGFGTYCLGDVIDPVCESIEIGRGVLSWDGGQRRSDEYGFVAMTPSGAEEPTEEVMEGLPIVHTELLEKHAGELGALVAEVLTVQGPAHIGDLAHGVIPTIPTEGERILLGIGTLTSKVVWEGGLPHIGVQPVNGRPRLKLDMVGLYRCHNNVVRLLWRPLPAADAEE